MGLLNTGLCKHGAGGAAADRSQGFRSGGEVGGWEWVSPRLGCRARGEPCPTSGT